MPGGMEESQDKGKTPEPPRNPYQEAFDEAERARTDPPVPGGSESPGPRITATAPIGGSRKKHIKKPEDFTNTKDWEDRKSVV